MMKITGFSHLFKWENLHNWWLTKYCFAPLYIYKKKCCMSDLYTHNCLYCILCFCYFVHCLFVYCYFCLMSCPVAVILLYCGASVTRTNSSYV